MDTGEEKSELGSLLQINQLDYRLAPSLSVATSRSLKSYASPRQTHVLGEDQIDLVFSSGASYVDLQASYIAFDVVIAGEPLNTDIKMPAHCSWIQLISGYRVIHSSGNSSFILLT